MNTTIEVPVYQTRQIVCPKGESVTLFRIGPHAALASRETTIDAAVKDSETVAISLAPFANPLNRSVHCAGCVAGCRVSFDLDEHAFLPLPESTFHPISGWTTTMEFSNEAFETARLEDLKPTS